MLEKKPVLGQTEIGVIIKDVVIGCEDLNFNKVAIVVKVKGIPKVLRDNII